MKTAPAASAGREATRLTIEAGKRGESVAVGEYDRFTTAAAAAWEEESES